MPRRVKQKSKASEDKIKNLLTDLNIENTYLSETLISFINYDIKMIKECQEKSIVDNYLYFLKTKFDINKTYDDNESLNLLKEVRRLTRNKLADEYAPDVQFEDTIDRYFNDVKREYIKHPMGESEQYEMSDDNRDLFIKNNLKTVIECAKRYRGMGLDFEDLIQIGNMGLLKAWNKFDTSKSDLRDLIIKDVEDFNKENFTIEEAKYIVTKNFRYPKLLDETLAKIPENGFECKDDFIKWANINIRKASFASLGFIWARAAITSELSAYSSIIKISKSKKSGDDKIVFINLDSLNPHTDDNFNDDELFEISNDEFIESDDNIENMERKDMFKTIVNEQLFKLSAKERRILMKRFGINTPYNLSISDIAENEGMTQREVKSCIEKGLQKISDNISEENKKLLIELL